MGLVSTASVRLGGSINDLHTVSSYTYVYTHAHLVEVEDDVELADVPEVAVQDLHEEVDHLFWGVCVGLVLEGMG